MNNMAKHEIDESREIFLRLAQYDDIFSDFDVRPYSRRSLSGDFLEEVKRASNDKYDNGIELVLYVPEKDRDSSKEEVISERLRNHFIKHFLILKKEKHKVLGMGVFMFLLGVASMLVATRILHEDLIRNAWFSFLSVFLEPMSIFLLWEGMDQIIFTSKKVDPELSFYRKMSHSEGSIEFKSGSIEESSN